MKKTVLILLLLSAIVSAMASIVTQNGSMDYPGAFSSKILAYNEWGGLVKDGGRGIVSIEYDGFGNPTEVRFSGNEVHTNVYSATGEKIKATTNVSFTIGPLPFQVMEYGDGYSGELGTKIGGISGVVITEYHGPFIYRDGKVDMVLFPGGYATLSGSDVTFHYYTQDYLGNNRAVINGSTGAIEQTVAYYPFGAVIADLGTPTTGQPYKFGGKELISSNGLNEYDFGARQYHL